MEKCIGRTKEGRKIDAEGENFEVEQRRVERLTWEEKTLRSDKGG